MPQQLMDLSDHVRNLVFRWQQGGYCGNVSNETRYLPNYDTFEFARAAYFNILQDRQNPERRDQNNHIHVFFDYQNDGYYWQLKCKGQHPDNKYPMADINPGNYDQYLNTFGNLLYMCSSGQIVGGNKKKKTRRTKNYKIKHRKIKGQTRRKK